MARLTDMIDTDTLIEESEMKCEKCGNEFEGETGDMDAKEALIEALETLIQMVEDDSLNEDELETLDETIEFISEDFGEDFEETLSEATLKKMSAKKLMAARKYRKKNKAKLARASKKRANKNKKYKKAIEKCKEKIKGKANKGCNSKGKIYRKKTRK